MKNKNVSLQCCTSSFCNITQHFTFVSKIMWISIVQAAKEWGINRTTIYRKIKSRELSKTEDNKIDPAEMSRVFGSPKLQWNKRNNVSENEKQHRATLQINLLQTELEAERKLRLQAENQVSEYKRLLEKSEQRIDDLFQHINTLKLLETPKEKSKKWFDYFSLIKKSWFL